MRKQRGCFPTSVIITRKYKVLIDNQNIILDEDEDDDDLDDSSDGGK